MPITIQSIQTGRVLTEGNPQVRDLLERQWTTGFYKMPVEGAVKMTELGIVGDAVADTRHHGGIDKAVLCYPAQHYDTWARELPELAMSGGAMGENLTLRGVEEKDVCIGDRFAVGDECEIEISQPRQPCWKISRRWGLKTLTKQVTQTGRTGWYVRVRKQGRVRAGQILTLLSRPNESWTIARANDIMYGREVDRVAVIELMNLSELADAWRTDIA